MTATPGDPRPVDPPEVEPPAAGPLPPGAPETEPPSHHTGDRAFLVAVAATLVVSALTSVQARLNGGLAVHLGNGFGGALVTTTIALAVLLVGVPSHPAGRRALRRIRAALGTRELRWWQLLGGVSGGLVLSTQGLTVPTLGVAVFTVATVAGSSTGSLVVDRFGLGPSGHHAISPARLGGALLAVLAVAVAAYDRLDDARTLWLVVLPALAGATFAWQSAVNGRVRAASSSAPAATLVNFVAATGTLTAAFLVSVAVDGVPTGALPPQPWYYVAGLIGTAFIAVAAAAVRHTGVLVFGLTTIAGQLVGAILVDLVAPTADRSPGLNTWAGAALTVAAVALASAGRRRRLGAPPAAPAER